MLLSKGYLLITSDAVSGVFCLCPHFLQTKNRFETGILVGWLHFSQNTIFVDGEIGSRASCAASRTGLNLPARGRGWTGLNRPARGRRGVFSEFCKPVSAS